MLLADDGLCCLAASVFSEATSGAASLASDVTSVGGSIVTIVTCELLAVQCVSRNVLKMLMTQPPEEKLQQ